MLEFDGGIHGRAPVSRERETTKAKTPSWRIQKGVSPNDASNTLPVYTTTFFVIQMTRRRAQRCAQLERVGRIEVLRE